MNPTQERWLPVVGWEGRYVVSSQGNVRSCDRTITDVRGVRRTLKGKALSQATNKNGYRLVVLCRDNLDKTQYVHQLVALAFIGPRPEGMVICHNNGDPSDNRASNIRFGTHVDNGNDMVLHGRNNVSKTHCPRGHFLSVPNLKESLYVKKGYRDCLACSRARAHIQRNPHLKPHLQQVADDYYARITA